MTNFEANVVSLARMNLITSPNSTEIFPVYDDTTMLIELVSQVKMHLPKNRGQFDSPDKVSLLH